MFLMDEIKISEFKTHCIRLLKGLKRKPGPLVVTLRGEQIAVIYPAQKPSNTRVLGGQTGALSIHGDIVNGDSSSDWESLAE